MPLSGPEEQSSSGLSIVTVCMNRAAHLYATAARVAAWPRHQEHLIVDWSSHEPLRRVDLPQDSRVRLLRVEAEPRWNLSRAYNFAFAQALGSCILKLDADCWPTAALDPDDPSLLVSMSGGEEHPSMLCAFGRGREGQNGQFLIARHLYEAVGGFNEFLCGYGFDDKDLRARLWLHLGSPLAVLPAQALGVIPHSDVERASLRGGGNRWLQSSEGLATLRASRQANRLLAAHCPWSARSPRSRYREIAPGRWRVIADSLPVPPADVAAEVEHESRITFWSGFLAIPEVFLEKMPYPLVPPARKGQWPVRWWHRIWWYVGRTALLIPIQALVLFRELLVKLRVAPRHQRRLP